MNADLLRRAAAELRFRATANSLTAAPWDCLDGGDRLVHIETASGAMEYVVDEPMSNSANADYIALMHPPVALALAGWLEAESAKFADAEDLAERFTARAADPLDVAAQEWASQRPAGYPASRFVHAVAVAREVLRVARGGDQA